MEKQANIIAIINDALGVLGKLVYQFLLISCNSFRPTILREINMIYPIISIEVTIILLINLLSNPYLLLSI